MRLMCAKLLHFLHARRKKNQERHRKHDGVAVEVAKIKQERLFLNLTSIGMFGTTTTSSSSPTDCDSSNT